MVIINARGKTRTILYVYYNTLIRKRKQDTPQDSRNNKMKNQRPINDYFEKNSEHKTPQRTRDNGVSVSYSVSHVYPHSTLEFLINIFQKCVEP